MLKLKKYQEMPFGEYFNVRELSIYNDKLITVKNNKMAKRDLVLRNDVIIGELTDESEIYDKLLEENSLVYVNISTINTEYREYFLSDGNLIKRNEGYLNPPFLRNYDGSPFDSSGVLVNDGSFQFDSNYFATELLQPVSKREVKLTANDPVNKDDFLMNEDYIPKYAGNVYTKGTLSNVEISVPEFLPENDGTPQMFRFSGKLIFGELDWCIIKYTSTRLSSTRTFLQKGKTSFFYYSIDEKNTWNFVPAPSGTDEISIDIVIPNRNIYIKSIVMDEDYIGFGEYYQRIRYVDVEHFGQRTSFKKAFSSTSLLEFTISADDICKGTNFSYAWYNCGLMASFPQLDVSNGTDFSFAWSSCTSLTSFPLLDVSNGIDFSWAWGSCNSLTSFPQLDVSKGTNFSYAWNYCTLLTSFPQLDVSKGTNFRSAWTNCISLTSFPQLDVSKGTNFTNTWTNCSSLTSFPLLDVSNGTNFTYAWGHCTSLTSFPQLDVSSGTDFNYAWTNCTSLTSFPQLDVSSGTDFSYAWYNCSSLTSFPHLDVSKGVNFYYAWRDCSSLTSFPQLDVSHGKYFSYAWYGCSSLPHCPAGNEVTIPAGATTTDMCYGIS